MNEKKKKSSLLISALVIIVIVGIGGCGIYQNSNIQEISTIESNSVSTEVTATVESVTQAPTTEAPTTEPITQVATKEKSRTKLFENILEGNTFNSYKWDDSYPVTLYFDERGGVTYTDLTCASYYYPYIVDDNVLTIYSSNVNEDEEDYSYIITYKSGVGAHGAYYDITLKSKDKKAPFNGEWEGEVIS
jgi:hypothetical protein